MNLEYIDTQLKLKYSSETLDRHVATTEPHRETKSTRMQDLGRSHDLTIKIVPIPSRVAVQLMKRGYPYGVFSWTQDDRKYKIRL